MPYLFGCLCMIFPGLSLADLQPTGHPNFLSPQVNPIVLDHKQTLFVTNTANDTVDVINTTNGQLVAQIDVGIDPVGLAIKPDGTQVWVANHVSDSLNIIDNNPGSQTYLHVIATIQDLDQTTQATRFDEPVGIVFANNSKAYVSLSSQNQIAVIDTASFTITTKLNVAAQDPRALFVHNDRLYVLPFESNNQTQISGCVNDTGGGLCTFDATEHVVTNNNVLSQNIVVDVIRHPAIPDRDLYVYDTSNDTLVQTVNGLGTLLYGIAVNSRGQVFITQTDARNDINGATGTMGDGLLQMGNRAFLNQVTQVDCSAATCQRSGFINLEPLPPINPGADQALATPYAIQISEDDDDIFITAASSNQLVILDGNNQQIISRTTVGSVPRGIALEYQDQNLVTAWIFNAASNSVSQVDVSDRTNPVVRSTLALTDPTHPDVKLGRMAFNDAKASSTGTFACESCHPDGGTDQLLWVLDTPPCSLPGCDQIPPRITMPIRGLRDTAPYHWDGIPGDPYGGINTASINVAQPANCELDDPESCTRDLVDGSLASTMCQLYACPNNDEGKAGALDASQRDAMARFLLSVPYPPAQKRAYTNKLSETAQQGFNLFHVLGDLQGGPRPNVCGDCHRMPFWVSTNTPGTGMEAPTWRGAYDRWLILPQGRLNIIDFNFYQAIATLGIPEERMWRLSWASRIRFNPVWNMVTEGSTGFSGAFGRQLTLNQETAHQADQLALLDALESAARQGGVLLQGSGVMVTDEHITPIDIEFRHGQYWLADDRTTIPRSALLEQAAAGNLVVTLTGRVGKQVDVDHPQPALWTNGRMHVQSGAQVFPTVDPASLSLELSGRHIDPAAHIIVDGKRLPGSIECRNTGQLPWCTDESIRIQLSHLPAQSGQHFLQVQNPNGLFSNDFIFYTTDNGSAFPVMDLSGPWYNPDQSGHGWYLELLDPLEADGPQRILAYWYTFHEGEPVWLLGQGALIEGQVQIPVMMTHGAQFPPLFQPADVSLIPWGFLELEFTDEDTAKALWFSDLEGFAGGSMPMIKLATIDDGADGCLSGSFSDPGQDGHGMGLQVIENGDEKTALLAWYTYINGQQTWLVGAALWQNQQATFTMNQLNGTGFPPAFSSGELNTIEWGTVQLQFNSNNQLNVEWNSPIEGYGSGNLVMQRLTQLAGHHCD